MNSIKIFGSLSLLAFVSTANAKMVTCGTDQRTASLDSASSCVIGLNNPKAATINSNFESVTDWSNEGELTGNGNNQYLSANLTSGSWGNSDIEATWAIKDNFWDLYGQAVISIHVGNGGGDPDYFSWLVDDKKTMGNWSYTKLLGGGGGLSNIKLWGANAPTTTIQFVPDTAESIPEPATAVLFGLGLIGLSTARRAQKKSTKKDDSLVMLRS